MDKTARTNLLGIENKADRIYKAAAFKLKKSANFTLDPNDAFEAVTEGTGIGEAPKPKATPATVAKKTFKDYSKEYFGKATSFAKKHKKMLGVAGGALAVGGLAGSLLGGNKTTIINNR